MPSLDREEFTKTLRKRFKKGNIEAILKVADFAGVAHNGQLRHNGAPFVTHPVSVASIVCDWHLDDDSICAALLHDVAEDTDFTIDDLQNHFGKSIAAIVNGVSKIEKIEKDVKQQNHQEHKTAETYRKMLLAISQDWRVILIKLADRLHNMRTLGNIKSRSSRHRIAQETLDIYAPIAERLGFQPVRDELQSLSFEHIYPTRYSAIKRALERSEDQQRHSIPKIQEKIFAGLKGAKIKGEIKTRSKNIYSVYRKMIEKDLSFSEVDDIIGFRVIVNDHLDCYTALGVMHSIYRPIPEKLKDYIARPKLNGYQSLHTTLLAQNGNIIELQIRTVQMDRFAESGVAAHWEYKDTNEISGKNGHDNLQEHTNRQLSSLYSMSKLGVEPGEYLKNLRLDLYPNNIFILTPQGDVMQLQRGSTVLDMGYAIHSDIGSSADHALVNNKHSAISTTLVSGDIVEIITSDKIVPKPKWLDFVATSKARVNIRNQLKEERTDKLVDLGKELLLRSLKRAGHNEEDISNERLEQYLKHNATINGKDEFYVQIALGIYHAEVVIKEILGPGTAEIEKDATRGILLAGDEKAGIIRANCCEPLPPEKIIGVMKRNKGLIVHRKDCSEIANLIKNQNFISMDWDESGKNSSYRVSLILNCTNKKGLVANVLSQFALEGVNIVSFNLDSAEESNPEATIAVVVEVIDAIKIEKLVRRISWIKGVTVNRAGASPLPDPA